MTKKATATKSGLLCELTLDIGEGGEALIKAGRTVAKDDTSRALPLRPFVGYAAPMLWGPKVTVASHIGSMIYTINYEAVGETLVLGRVTYWKGSGAGKQVTEEFSGETTITTSNSVANVECEFKGIPTGSAVNGTIQP